MSQNITAGVQSGHVMPTDESGVGSVSIKDLNRETAYMAHYDGRRRLKSLLDSDWKGFEPQFALRRWLHARDCDRNEWEDIRESVFVDSLETEGHAQDCLRRVYGAFHELRSHCSVDNASHRTLIASIIGNELAGHPRSKWDFADHEAMAAASMHHDLGGGKIWADDPFRPAVIGDWLCKQSDAGLWTMSIRNMEGLFDNDGNPLVQVRFFRRTRITCSYEWKGIICVYANGEVKTWRGCDECYDGPPYKHNKEPLPVMDLEQADRVMQARFRVATKAIAGDDETFNRGLALSLCNQAYIQACERKEKLEGETDA